jgi:diguanylate cyclase (GGDEF)-like protein
MASDTQVRRILLVHNDPVVVTGVRELLSSLRNPRHIIAHYQHLIDGMTYLMVNPVDLILIGPKPADVSQVAAIEKISAAHPEIPTISLMEKHDPDQRLRLLGLGSSDCLCLNDMHQGLWISTFNFCLREYILKTELASATARMDWMMNTDSLTGLLNRKGMENATLKCLSKARDAGNELHIMLIDLDEFTRINSTLGHGVGDLVLMAAGRRITEIIGSNDHIGRVGTDRFIVVLEDGCCENAAVLAEKIRLAISRDVIQAGDHSLATTASLGVTAVSTSAISFDEVLAQAHFVLQRSKLKGKNRVSQAASTADVQLIQPVDVGPEMTRALLRGNVLEVFSQPIVNLLDGRIISQEMLIRGPNGPLKGPDALFRYCQEKDILTAVDLRCLKKCAKVAGAVAAGGAARYHVNIMPATLLQTPVDELIRVLQVSDDYGHCCLELSEQQLLGDPAVLLPRVRSLQEAGIRIAIDDVGYGKSHLENLLMLNPQVMKVDKRLVLGLASDDEMRHTLSRLLKMADVLGAEVVAEGIEDADDYRVLLEMGVRFGQGYLFGMPKLCVEPMMGRILDDDIQGARAEA